MAFIQIYFQYIKSIHLCVTVRHVYDVCVCAGVCGAQRKCVYNCTKWFRCKIHHTNCTIIYRSFLGIRSFVRLFFLGVVCAFNFVVYIWIFNERVVLYTRVYWHAQQSTDYTHFDSTAPKYKRNRTRFKWISCRFALKSSTILEDKSLPKQLNPNISEKYKETHI